MADITNPDGTPLRSAWHQRGGKRMEGDVIETENMANRRAMSDAYLLRVYGAGNSGAPNWQETVARCLAALAHKRGTTVEVERKALDRKIEAKYRRLKTVPIED